MNSQRSAVESRILADPAADPQLALEYFRRLRLSCETDPFDVHHDLTKQVSGFVVVDARTSSAYRQERLPGAVNLPHEEITGAGLATLDRNEVYVTYGWSPGCNAGTKAAARLAAAGLRVKEMIGGLEYWKRQGYPTEFPR